MTRKTFNMISAAAIVVGAACASSAHADQWCLNYDGYGSHRVMGLNYDASRSWDSVTRTTFSGIKVGEHKFNAYGGSISTFCVQLFEGLTAGNTVCFDVVAVEDVPEGPPAPGPMGSIAATLIQDLYARYYQYVTDGSLTASERDMRCAAFGVAIYELSHENFDAADAAGAAAQASLVNGAFQADANDPRVGANDAFNLAASMLASLGSGGFRSLGDNLLGLTNPDFQDQLVVVPIPAALGLAAVGLVGVRALRRRAKA